MKYLVGVFDSKDRARQAERALAAHCIDGHRVYVVDPDDSDAQIASLPSSEAEMPGAAQVLGAVVGAGFGMAIGFGIAAAASVPVNAQAVWMFVGGLAGVGAGLAAGHALGA
ncbi:MAG: hypothetical protein JO041_15785, partial [Acidobacteria bacterium]|nr:hypothetical protein [Acidobacteriota bacterium]